MFFLLIITSFVFSMRIIIDVGYYGKEVTSMKNFIKYTAFDNHTRSMNIKMYGNRENEKSEKIDFQIFNVNQFDKKSDKCKKCDKTKEHSKKVEFYCYTRMFNKLSDYVLACPFISVNHDFPIRAWSQMNDIVLIHHIFSKQSAIYMIVDTRKSGLKYKLSSHFLMNLVLYIFNNSQYFDKISKKDLISQIHYVLINNNVQLEFLNSPSTLQILENNIPYLIEKYHLNYHKSYNSLIEDFELHLRESIYNYVKDNINVVEVSEFNKLVKNLLFISIIDICNIIPQICDSKFNVVGAELPEEIKKESIVLERCLILEIETEDFNDIIEIDIEGQGDLYSQPLVYIQVNQSRTFIIGCNQLYCLYKKKIYLKISLITNSKTIEEKIDVSDIILFDNN